jgi:hypothetical protein
MTLVLLLLLAPLRTCAHMGHTMTCLLSATAKRHLCAAADRCSRQKVWPQAQRKGRKSSCPQSGQAQCCKQHDRRVLSEGQYMQGEALHGCSNNVVKQCHWSGQHKHKLLLKRSKRPAKRTLTCPMDKRSALPISCAICTRLIDFVCLW